VGARGITELLNGLRAGQPAHNTRIQLLTLRNQTCPEEDCAKEGIRHTGSLSKSFNNTEKGWYKPRVMLSLKHSGDSLAVWMSSSQHRLPGFRVSRHKLFKRLEVFELKL